MAAMYGAGQFDDKAFAEAIERCLTPGERERVGVMRGFYDHPPGTHEFIIREYGPRYGDIARRYLPSAASQDRERRTCAQDRLREHRYALERMMAASERGRCDSAERQDRS